MELLRAIALLACLAAAAQAEETPRPAERYVRIGHYQCICRQGDFDANLNTVLHGLELAAEARIQIMTFPESFLTGYFLRRDDAWRHSFAVDSPEMRQLLKRTARFDILFIVGFNERRGDKIFNTVAVIDRGRVVGTYSKAFPGMYFAPGREFPSGLEQEVSLRRHPSEPRIGRSTARHSQAGNPEPLISSLGTDAP